MSASPWAAARIPATSSWIEASFRRWPEGREERIGDVAVLVGVVSTKTRVSGAISAMCRVASTPPIPGMLRSITTTSGELADVRDGLGSGGGLTDDLEALLGEEVPQACAEQILVVGEQDAKRLRRPRFLLRLDQLRHCEAPLRAESVPDNCRGSQ